MDGRTTTAPCPASTSATLCAIKTDSQGNTVTVPPNITPLTAFIVFHTLSNYRGSHLMVYHILEIMRRSTQIIFTFLTGQIVFFLTLATQGYVLALFISSKIDWRNIIKWFLMSLTIWLDPIKWFITSLTAQGDIKIYSSWDSPWIFVLPLTTWMHSLESIILTSKVNILSKVSCPWPLKEIPLSGLPDPLKL